MNKIKEDEMSGYVARIGIWEVYTKFWSVNLKVGDYSEDLSVVGSVILEWFLVK